MEESKKTRQHETIVEIPAPVEQVWRAITDPSQVQAWFAPKARITPQVGGDYVVSWGEGMEGSGKIEVFDEPAHLRVVSQRDLAGAGPVQTAVDYFLESHEDKTVLRLVHSGFLSSSEWDKEFDGTRKGWPMMLRVLTYGVMHRPNMPGQQSWSYIAKNMDISDAWNAVTQSAHLDTVYYARPQEEFCATWNQMGDGLVYLAFGQKGDTTGISMNVILYGDATTRIGEATEFWKRELEAR